MKFISALLAFLLAVTLFPISITNIAKGNQNKGRIYGHVSAECIPTTIKIVGTNGTTYTGTFTPNGNGDYETSPSDGSNCILPCPGTYIVTVNKPGYNTSPTSKTITMMQCCGISYQANFDCRKGARSRISGSINGGCEPVTIKIEGIEGTDYTQTITTGFRGTYESSPAGIPAQYNIYCPGKYKVTPIKAGYKFVPASRIITITTCQSDSSGYKADFNCGDTGRIYGNITGQNQDPISITIEGIDNSYSGTFQASRGFFQTSGTSSSQCLIPCPGKYKITPRKPRHDFEPPNHIIYLEKSCPGSGIAANFVCRKNPQQYGRITGMVHGPWYTTVMVKGINGTNYSGTFKTNSEQYYETSTYASPTNPDACMLPCPGTYTVTPINEDYTFSPPSQTITMSQCCGYSYTVNFTSKPARITAKIAGQVKGCTPAFVSIYDGDGKLAWSGSTKTSQGYYGTSSGSNNCILDCSKTYKVVPYKAGYSFIPPSRTITFTRDKCCDKASSTYVGYQIANFDCVKIEPKGRIKVILKGDFAGATVRIETLDSPPKVIVSGGVDIKGIFDSTCLLVCGKTYNVVVTPRATCKGGVQSKKVAVKNCCPEKFEQVLFTMTCPKPYGRIYGKISGDCSAYAKITIKRLDAAMTAITLTANSNGEYDSKCKLPCPGKYSLTPIISNSKCTYTPASKTVSITQDLCCDKSIKVDFVSVKPTMKRIGTPKTRPKALSHYLLPVCPIGTDPVERKVFLFIEIIDPITHHIWSKGVIFIQLLPICAIPSNPVKMVIFNQLIVDPIPADIHTF